MAEKYIFIIIEYSKADKAVQALAALLDSMNMGRVALKDGVAITKTSEGELILHRSLDDMAANGFLNGGLMGIFFEQLFGYAGWDTKDALADTAFSMLDQGIKDILLDELGDKMTPSESAVALLVEHLDWPDAGEQRRVRNFRDVIVISQTVMGDLTIAELQPEEQEPPTSVPQVVEPPASIAVKDIEGIGDAYSGKLIEVGIKNVDQLLEKGSTPHGREELAKTTGISGKLLLRWINMADLYRIRGIGQEYAELLEAAGVDTVPELAQRVPANLLKAMEAANAEKKMVRRLPVLAHVEDWVAQAKNLPRVITY